MKLLVESHIPYLRGVLEQSGAEVVYREVITPEDAADADALLIRTRTRCNAALLAGSRVRWIGTATIGTDHIDLPYCRREGITVVNAPGCNAPAVAQWTLAAVAVWMHHRGIATPRGLRMGIVGVGHVGTIVARWAQHLGFDIMCCDPPLARHGDSRYTYVALPELLQQCHILTVHTPLTLTGVDATHHLISADALRHSPQLQLVVNAARGGICDDAALARWHGDIAIDCWENEPHPLPALPEKALVATPHIAGYSIEGKQRATAALLHALNRRYGWHLPVPEVIAPACGVVPDSLQAVLNSYHPGVDTNALRLRPDTFEMLRNHYALRHEYASQQS